MSAVRVCAIADIECHNGCANGPCRREYGCTTTATTGNPAILKLADLERTVEKLRGLPPTKWMLVSPEGHVWSDEDPMVLASVLAMRKFGWPNPISGISSSAPGGDGRPE